MNYTYKTTGFGKFVFIGICLIVGLSITVVALLLDDDTPAANLPPAAPAQHDGEQNIVEIQREAEEQVARGMFETHMNTTWIFPDGASPSTNAVMGNSVNNNFPFWFTVTLRDAGDIIFTSSLLPVGTEIAEIRLDTELPAGEFPAVVHINMVDEAEEPIEGNMGINITLRVES